MAKGFGGVPGNMQALMKQAQKMQADLAKAQADAENFTADAQAGGGVVRAVANGKNQLLSIEIKKEAVNPDDVELLQEMVLLAVNGALEKVQEFTKSTLSKAAGGVNIPGLF